MEKKNKFNWKLMLPTIALFASPWMHWLIYHNFKLAWPNASDDLGHWFGIGGAVLALWLTCILAMPGC